jgi:DNA-binding transcriptional ArsR family regulator
MPEKDTLSRTFSALADPTRRAILDHLAREDATVSELSAPFEISAPAISRHLRVLEASGLIVQQRHGSWRTNSLQSEPLAEVASYLDRYRVFLGASFDRLRDHLHDQPGDEQGES